MDFIVRKVQRSDNSSLAEIIRDAFVEFDAPRTGTVYSEPTTDKLYQLFHNQKDAVLFVAENKTEVLGCCGIYPTKGLESDTAELVKFYLSKASRGKGIGKQLFEQSIEAAKQMGYKKLYIESQPKFNTALGLYEKYNFNYLDQPLGDSGHGNCDIWMLKNL